MEKLIQYCTKASLYDGPFDSVVGWAAAGMGYLFKTANGHLVVVDGGNCEDAEAFVSLLEMNASTALPEIDLWIITHPHGDHYGALLEIAAGLSWQPYPGKAAGLSFPRCVSGRQR